MKLRLKHRIIILVGLSALAPVFIILILSSFMENRVSSNIDDKIQIITEENVLQKAEQIHGLCETTNTIFTKEIEYNLQFIRYLVKLEGGINLAKDYTTWEAVNQYTHEKIAVDLPKMQIGNTWFGRDTTFNQKMPIVDEAAKLRDGDYTIFQRMNDAGDMLRVATTVRKLDGSRALGTYIPKVNPDGKMNPVISTVLSGRTYRGRAFVVNAWYQTAYEPLFNNNGEVFGILFTGVKQAELENVGEIIQHMKIGKTGSVIVISGSGEKRGHVLFSADENLIDKNMLEFTDPDGNYIFRNMIAGCANLEGNESFTTSFVTVDDSTGNNIKKVAGVSYFKPWDWMIVPISSEEDFGDFTKEISDSLSDLFWSVLFGGLIILVFTVMFAIRSGSRIAEPITRLTDVASLIAKGEISAAGKMLSGTKIKKSLLQKMKILSYVNIESEDETEKLLFAISKMTESLRSLVSKIHTSSDTLKLTSHEIAVTSKQQERTAGSLNTTTNEIVATSNQITATAKELANTMNDVTKVSGSTKVLADEGNKGIDEMSLTMDRLVKMSKVVSEKLNAINNKSHDINDIIAAITKVADQTNLLSLNAAIESEKAGEYGKGFAIVANEIKRLANQTAVSTLDIVTMINEMQSVVDDGVNEMDRFYIELDEGVNKVNRINTVIEQIIDNVQDLTPRFTSVNEGMQNQTLGAEQINVAMKDLNDASRESLESIKEFRNAIKQLDESVKSLTSEITHYKIDE
ncbi:MAG: methyl-accepting chemotaxis protein [Melioribacteraceae bacterium]|nr:methyl-accepting chemotaxis protein [Melioribacteraceae bacterium]MCF8354002.1 methyl-accepting chemotaxis protein [Melioribacteraceae bacterium]MCF8392317.1 methyl-accepting chemotaxis protein [Melioribacteraceae bacterium]MCF8417649.1 methyl-accepting chemotaxis protein [Melioribacteraceae bacterium]